MNYGFNQIADGSLSSGGVEFVSNAFNGDLLLKKTRDFCGELRKRKYFVDGTCGFHLHIGISKRLKYLKKIILFYIKYEDFIFKMLPKSRQDNHYCKRIKQIFPNLYLKLLLLKTDGLKELDDLKKLVYNTNRLNRIKYFTKEKYNDARYCWLNLHSVFYRGTIEIRSHSGTIEKHKITNWIKIHLTLLDFIKNKSLDEIKNLEVTEETFLNLFDEKLRKYILNRYKTFNPEQYQTAKPEALKDVNDNLEDSKQIERGFIPIIN